MRKKKIVESEEPKEVKEEVMEIHVSSGWVGCIEPLTQEFGNGDLNVLRDKINEIIKVIK
jgi:predicted membrane protein